MKITINNETNKSFSYEKEGVTLRFVLNLDKKNDINIFRELLEQALKDIKEL